MNQRHCGTLGTSNHNSARLPDEALLNETALLLALNAALSDGRVPQISPFPKLVASDMDEAKQRQ
jgi:hypothetical protein